MYNSFAGMLANNGYAVGTKTELAKSLFDEHSPYVIENDANYMDYVIMLTSHFKGAYLDALSWDDTDFDMSKEEMTLYRLYSAWAVGKTDLRDERFKEKLKAVNAMDNYIVQEIYNKPCTVLKTFSSAGNRAGYKNNNSPRYLDTSNYKKRK